MGDRLYKAIAKSKREIGRVIIIWRRKVCIINRIRKTESALRAPCPRALCNLTFVFAFNEDVLQIILMQ